MFVRYYDSEKTRLVAALWSPRIVIADLEAQRALSVIPIRDAILSAFDLSGDARLLVVGYWSAPGVELWDVKEQKRLDSFGPGSVSRVAFDRSGRYVVLRSTKGSRVRCIESGKEKRIKFCEDLYGAALQPSKNTMLIPIRRKSRAIKLNFRVFRLSDVVFPIDREIWTMRWSPSEDRLLVMDSANLLTCFRDTRGKELWSTVLSGQDRSSQASFCADGSLIGAYAVNSHRTIVLDAFTGEIARYIEQPVVGHYPFGPKSLMTTKGLILDLANGAVDEGVSSWRWWRAAGA